MKRIIIAMLTLIGTASFAQVDSLKWTSDTTYVRGGVEYWDPIQSHYSKWERMFARDPELERGYNSYWMIEAPKLKRPDLDDQKESSIV